MKKKSKFVSKSGLITALIVFAVVIAAAGFITAGFTLWSPDDVADHLSPNPNPDNLYTADACVLRSGQLDNDVKLEVNDNGSFKLDGTASASKILNVGTVILNAGTYTLTAFEDASLSSVYMTATVGEDTYNFDFIENDGNVITISSDNTSVTLELHIIEDAELDNVKVYPVIVAGTEAGEFFE